MSGSLCVLDGFYAGFLGCSPGDLSTPGLKVVRRALDAIRFAKGRPLLLYGLAKSSGGVLAVGPGRGMRLEQAMVRLERAIEGAATLDDATCSAVEEALAPVIGSGVWFRGVRLFCEPASFLDHRFGEVREIRPEEDDRASLLRDLWQGAVFGQIVGNKIVSRAAVKPVSSEVWDISVETEPDSRGRGYAKSVVSAALVHVFSSGALAGWGCDRTNFSSLGVAHAVGFKPYGLDFGFVAET